jgi:site-specific recombinase XerD
MGEWVWAPTVSGPLAEHAAGFERWLRARGFSGSGVFHRIWQFDHLSRWLQREGLRPDQLTPARQEQFLADRRAAGYLTWISARSLRVPLAYLRELGVAAPAGGITDRPVDRLLGDYRRYLTCERGLAQSTCRDYERVARLFLAGHEREGGPGLELLSAAGVSVFLARECPRRSIASAQQLVTGLRALLRYLHLAGVIELPLRWAVPPVAGRRGLSLPRGLEPAVVVRMLNSCDRRRLTGRRDYAILLLLARLGLRAGEVAAIRLEDLDWRAGELLVRGKGNRHERLPLPVDVGTALVSYLRWRPRSECRAAFLCVRAPLGPVSAGVVSQVVRAACTRAGVERVGAHRLRHTAATEMLRAGSSLPEIAQVLRHQRLETTAQYARVDRQALRTLARPWPGSAR